jgi:hypothetical protein
MSCRNQKSSNNNLNWEDASIDKFVYDDYEVQTEDAASEDSMNVMFEE